MSQPPNRYIYIDADHMGSTAKPRSGGLLGWLRRQPALPVPDTKLQALVQTLEQEGEMGTLAAPKSYFRGRLAMRWGSLLTPGAADPQLTYFGGSTDQAILGLVGKTGGLNGTSGAATLLTTSAWMPYLFALLEPALAYSFAGKQNGLIRPDDPQDRQKAAQAVRMATMQEQRRDPPLEVEVCARTLLVGTADPWQEFPRIVLGIPLYVALAAPANAAATIS